MPVHTPPLTFALHWWTLRQLGPFYRDRYRCIYPAQKLRNSGVGEHVRRFVADVCVLVIEATRVCGSIQSGRSYCVRAGGNRSTDVVCCLRPCVWYAFEAKARALAQDI